MVAAQVILCLHVTEVLTMHFPVILSPSCQPHHDITWILLSVSLCKRELWQSWMFRGCSCDYVPLQISCFWKPNKLQLGNVTCSLFVYCDMSLLTWHVRIRYYIVLSLLKVVIKGKIISTSGLTLWNTDYWSLSNPPKTPRFLTQKSLFHVFVGVKTNYTNTWFAS